MAALALGAAGAEEELGVELVRLRASDAFDRHESATTLALTPS